MIKFIVVFLFSINVFADINCMAVNKPGSNIIYPDNINCSKCKKREHFNCVDITDINLEFNDLVDGVFIENKDKKKAYLDKKAAEEQDEKDLIQGCKNTSDLFLKKMCSKILNIKE